MFSASASCNKKFSTGGENFFILKLSTDKALFSPSESSVDKDLKVV